MPTNDFLTFATASGANVETQAAYAADPQRTAGFQTGVAPSAPFNKAWRQACFMAAVVANYIFTTLGVDVLDDGNLAGKTTLLTNAILATIAAVGYAPLASPTFTGTVNVPTVAGSSDSSTKASSTAFVQACITVVNTTLALKAALASPAFTGVPTVPTAAAATNTTQAASCAFVEGELNGLYGVGYFPKSWVKFTVSGTTPTVVQQHGVTSVVRNSTGNYTVTTNQSLVAGAVQITASDSGGGPNSQGAGPSGGVVNGANVLKFTTLANTAADPDTVFAQFY